MKAKPIITAFLIVVIAVVLIGMLMPFFDRAKISHPTKVRVEIAGLIFAIKGYESEFGPLPSSENSKVVMVLTGDNPKKIRFLNFQRLAENPSVMFDPWKTPYQFQFLEETNFIICSAGKDKTFGTADDIIFNSISNDFVKP